MKQGGDALLGLAVLAICCGLPVLLIAAGVLTVSALSRALAVGAALLAGALIMFVAAGRRRHV